MMIMISFSRIIHRAAMNLLWQDLYESFPKLTDNAADYLAHLCSWKKNFFGQIYLSRGRSLMIRLDKTRFNTKS